MADWSFSSSETRERKKSEESTSVELKCCLARVDFPAPDGPTSRTTHHSGIRSFLIKLNSLMEFAAGRLESRVTGADSELFVSQSAGPYSGWSSLLTSSSVLIVNGGLARLSLCRRAMRIECPSCEHFCFRLP